MLLEKIKRPTLILDKSKCLRNIEFMINKANENHIQLRPHFKTHQSHEVGRWFRNYGIKAITVSSVRMATYFAADDWKDITIAFPHNMHESEQVAELAKHIQLNIVAENIESLMALSEILQSNINVFIKADTGYHRTGLGIEQKDQIDQIINFLSEKKHFNFKGFLIHAGHTYKKRSHKGINNIHQESLEKISQFRAIYEPQFPDLTISYGDTPSCSTINHFEGINEIRPGNFAFYDLSQWHISSCSLDQIAVALACPVVAKHPERSEVIIYGGGVHFSKDRAIDNEGKTYFGLVVSYTENSWKTDPKGAYISSLSQEHGTIKGTEEWVNSIKIGDILFVLPVHSCMSADLMKEYLTTGGDWIRDVMRLS